MERLPTMASTCGEATPSTHRMLSKFQSMTSGDEVILGERVVETEVKVPRLIRKESIREKIVKIPEKVITEEIVEETQTIRERVIQVKKPIIVDKFVEEIQQVVVPVDVEYPVTETHYIEKHVDLPLVEERLVVKTKPVEIEKIVQVPGDDILVERVEIKIVDVPKTTVIEVPKYNYSPTQVQEIEYPVYIDKEEIVQVKRKVPQGHEHKTHLNYHLPQLHPEYTEIPYPVFVPIFVQVPLPEDSLTDKTLLECKNLISKVEYLTSQSHRASLCAIEEVAQSAKKFVPEQNTDPEVLRKRMVSKFEGAVVLPSPCPMRKRRK